MANESENSLSFFGEVIGLRPLPLRLRQACKALMGEADVPRSKWGISSLSQLHLRVAKKLWKGQYFVERKVVISNLFNHTQTPISDGWSVKRTQVLDFRGRRLTYNSHNGTDFAVPVGSTVCTAAPGKVVAVISEFNRGGLKIFIDHGQGLMTCYAHLARALVHVGSVLKRGSPIAISGYSGLDAAVSFPFGMPHVHFNVWLNGEPADPFAHGDKVSMWRHNLNSSNTDSKDELYEPSVYAERQLNTLIHHCKTESVRQHLYSIQDVNERAVQTIIQSNYYPTRFEKRVHVYDKVYPRSPVLDIPFLSEQFDGIVFLDDVLPSVIRREKRHILRASKAKKHGYA